MGKIVHYDFDKLPPLTAEDKALLKVLADRPDSEIDYSDIPSIGDRPLDNAVRGKFYRKLRLPVTVQLDRGVLEWLRSDGQGIDDRINSVLRKEMLAATKSH